MVADPLPEVAQRVVAIAEVPVGPSPLLRPRLVAIVDKQTNKQKNKKTKKQTKKLTADHLMIISV